MIPWVSPSPQSKWHHDRFSCFHTDDRRVFLYFTMEAHLPQSCPLPWGHLNPHLIHDSLGQPESSTQTASRSVQPFCTDDRRVSLFFTIGPPSPPQNCLFPSGDLNPYLIHGPLGPPKFATQMASRSVQPFLHGSLV